ncbi:MAG TPA: hypothetical protein VMY76_13865 [Gemmatimonadales bacterium]|nr:hypothetical protein [Gemmatimonadales bacterium]
MHSLSTIHLLRALHVLAGVFWVGSVFFIAWFLSPAIRSTGPAGGAVMQHLAQAGRLPVWLMAATVVTVLSGIGLYSIDSAGFHSAWLGSGPGRTFGIGGVLGIVAATLGMVVNAPTARRLGSLAARIHGSGTPPAAQDIGELQRLQSRLAWATRTAAVLLALATLAMAVARYVP